MWDAVITWSTWTIQPGQDSCIRCRKSHLRKAGFTTIMRFKHRPLVLNFSEMIAKNKCSFVYSVDFFRQSRRCFWGFVRVGQKLWCHDKASHKIFLNKQMCFNMMWYLSFNYNPARWQMTDNVRTKICFGCSKISTKLVMSRQSIKVGTDDGTSPCD